MKSLRHGFARLFGWGERITRINLRSFLHGWAWLFSGQIIGTATALLLALGYAHFLSQETYGTYKYVLAIFGILSVFSLPGMGDAVQKGVAQGREGVFWDTFKKRLCWSFFGGLLSAVIGIYYFINGNSLLAAVFVAVSPFLVFTDTFSHFNALLMGRKQYRQVSFYAMGIQVLSALVIFIVVFLTNEVFYVVLAYVASFTLFRGLAFWDTVHRYPPNNVHDKDGTRYGSHMSVLNVFGLISGQLDSILLWHFLGPVPLAIFSFAQAASDHARKAFKLVTTSMAFTTFAGQDKKTIQATLLRKVLLAHFATVPLAIMLALIVPYLYYFLFPTYIASIPYAQVMLLLLAFTPTRLLSTAVNAKGSINDIYFMNLSVSVTQSLLLIVLVPFFGIWGAIFAAPLQTLITGFISLRIFKRM